MEPGGRNAITHATTAQTTANMPASANTPPRNAKTRPVTPMTVPKIIANSWLIHQVSELFTGSVMSVRRRIGRRIAARVRPCRLVGHVAEPTVPSVGEQGAGLV